MQPAANLAVRVRGVAAAVLAGELVARNEGEEVPMTRCPKCGCKHRPARIRREAVARAERAAREAAWLAEQLWPNRQAGFEVVEQETKQRRMAG